LIELWNYYKIGILNTIFGLSVYSGLVFLGLNLFIAQIIGQIAGVIFNYFTYSRHVFSAYERSIWRFVGVYGVNYFFAVATLYGVHQLIRSPYLAGFVTAGIVSVVNYFLLRRLVFRKPRS
jgi:putative flippase GtrA